MKFSLTLDRWVEAPDSEVKKSARIGVLAILSVVVCSLPLIGLVAFIAAFPVAGIVLMMLVLIAFMSWLLKD